MRISRQGISIIFGTLGQDTEPAAVAIFILDPFNGVLVKAEKFPQASGQFLLSFFQKMIRCLFAAVFINLPTVFSKVQEERPLLS